MFSFSRLQASLPKIRYLWYFLLPLLITGFRENAVVQQWDSSAFDRLISLRPAERQDDRLVIVTIDEDDLKKESSIPDQTLAVAINLIAAAQPQVIGVDIMRDGKIAPELQAAYRKHENVIGISKLLPPDPLPVPLGLPSDRAGFGDYTPDTDSLVRRAQLAYFSSEKSGENAGKQTVSYSFAFQVARLYLQRQGQKIQIARQQLNLGGRSISPLEPSSDNFDVLVNYRHSYPADHSFQLVKLADVLAQKPLNLRGKVVILGYSAATKHDFVNANIFPESSNKINGNILGAEYHSYIVSQLIATAIDGRSFIQPLPVWGDYLWIFGCIVSSGLLLRTVRFKTPFWLLLTVVFVYTTGVCLSIYFLFLVGWLLPIGLTSSILMINLPLLMFYQREQSLLAVAEKRQQAITETFNAIHNGPLQELSLLLQAVKSENIALSAVGDRLEHLNLQIRHIGESLQQSASKELPEMLVLGDGERLNLNMPLNELLHLVADRTLYNDRYPNLSGLKVKVINFQELPSGLSVDQKRQLCQFLEEAIGNVEKYAVRATRLQLLGRVSGEVYRLSVEDNGQGEISNRVGQGTKQARRLAASLGGRFERFQNRSASGIICFIEWNCHE